MAHVSYRTAWLVSSCIPFVGTVSIDSLYGERLFNALRDPQVVPYDLVVFDEVHKLSANRDPDGTFRATDRYRLTEAIAA